MIQINLSPWREHARQAMQIRLGLVFASVIVLTIVAMLCMHVYFKSLITSQNARNIFLQSEIDKAQTDFTNSKQKKLEQTNLVAELNFIMNLQHKSFSIIYLLNELATIAPTSVLLEKIARDGNTITVTGKARSDLQITYFIKGLAKTKGFSQPELTEIKSQDNNTAEERHFQLKIELQDK